MKPIVDYLVFIGTFLLSVLKVIPILLRLLPGLIVFGRSLFWLLKTLLFVLVPVVGAFETLIKGVWQLLYWLGVVESKPTWYSWTKGLWSAIEALHEADSQMKEFVKTTQKAREEVEKLAGESQTRLEKVEEALKQNREASVNAMHALLDRIKANEERAAEEKRLILEEARVGG